MTSYVPVVLPNGTPQKLSATDVLITPDTAANLYSVNAASRTALATVDGTLYPVVYLSESGRKGWFGWSSANNASNVSNDPAQGIYVPPTSDSSGASGAWVRIYSGLTSVLWFGLATSASDNTAALNDMITTLNAGLIGSMFFPAGTYKFTSGPPSKITASSYVITSDLAELLINSGTNGTFFQLGDYAGAISRRVLVENLYLVCTNSPTSVAFIVDNVNGCTIQNITTNNVGGLVRVGYGSVATGSSQCPNFTMVNWVGSFNGAQNLDQIALYAGSGFKMDNCQVTSSTTSTAKMINITGSDTLDTIRISDSSISANGHAYSLYVDCSTNAVTNIWCDRSSFVNATTAAIAFVATTGTVNSWSRHHKFVSCYISTYGGQTTILISNASTKADIDAVEFIGCTIGYTSPAALITQNTSTGTVTGTALIGCSVDDETMYVSGCSNTDPVVVTLLHPYALTNGQSVKFSDVRGMTELNGNSYTVANFNASASTFELSGIDGTSWSAGSGGYADIAKTAAIQLGVGSARIIGNLFDIFLHDSALSNTHYAVQTTADIDDFIVAENEINAPTALNDEYAYAAWSNNRVWANNYGAGAVTSTAPSVTQSTSKSTSVTLNSNRGTITMNAASLAAGAAVSFTLTNSAIVTGSIVTLNILSGATANAYTATISAVTSGSCSIQLHNISGGALAQAVVLGFQTIALQ